VAEILHLARCGQAAPSILRHFQGDAVRRRAIFYGSAGWHGGC
jgi:hypothetical protein